mmetsp:Transcript_26635/g.57803  ORF Transcript_26635/g.57803 Transcript_26635/m.57803 type:complete len:268 (-) Transcript_26635:68-871(-)
MKREYSLLQSTLILVAIFFGPASNGTGVGALTLLSDLATPSFVIDLRTLRKRCVEVDLSDKIPSLQLPRHDVSLYPFKGGDDATTAAATALDRDAPTISLDLQDRADQAAVGYLHTSVIRPRDAESSAFLAELDVTPSLCGSDGARLVLGLNNHHVGSYYWARSAGAGSSMDAIGITFGDADSDGGILQWEDDDGPVACNSNDGKRSEWANFLRAGDTVQLVPMGSSGEDSLMEFLDRYGCVYGISPEGRPMGSEPAVVCEWRRLKH